LKKGERKVAGGDEWEVQFATRRSKKGKAMGGMLIGIRKNMLEKGRDFKRLLGGIENRVR